MSRESSSRGALAAAGSMLPRLDPAREALRTAVACWPFRRGSTRLKQTMMKYFQEACRTGVIARAGIDGVLFPYTSRLVSTDYFWLVYESEIRKLLRKVLSPGAVFIDIGAHRGFHSSFALGLVGNRGAVLACEPVEENVEGLRFLARLNPKRNLIVEHAAISSATGESTFYLSDHEGWSTLDLEFLGRAGGAAPIGTRIVPTLTLDDLLAKYFKGVLGGGSGNIVIKIDAEGAELDILRGAKATLGRPNVRAIIMECTGGSKPFRERSESCVQILKSHGLAIRVITPAGARDWTAGDAGSQVNILAFKDGRDPQ